MKRLRVWDPGTPVVLACRPGLGDFFLRHQLVDEVVEIDKKSPGGRDRALAELRAREWDYILVPHQSVRTALWMWRLRARRGKVSFRMWWNGFFYDTRVTKPMAYPDALRQLSLLAPLDANIAELFAEPGVDALKNPLSQSTLDFRDLPIPEWSSMQVIAKAGTDSSKRIFLAPGSVWGTKRWTVKGYAELAKALLAKGYSITLVGSKEEEALCKELTEKVPGIENRAGSTKLADLVELLASGRALVCNDSGAMHAAAAAGLPTVAIFGPTTLDLGFRPWNASAIVVQRQLSCRPCGAHGPQVCPLGTHECMESVSAVEVLAVLGKLGI